MAISHPACVPACTMKQEHTLPTGAGSPRSGAYGATQWREIFQGGSPQAEHAVFQRLAQDVMKLQLIAMRRRGASSTMRAFHAKQLFATRRASLRIADDVPEDLRIGWVSPGRTYPIVLRFSNAGEIPQPDDKPDLRGVALRVFASGNEHHDLLMTNFPVSHARDAGEFVAFALATAGGLIQKLLGVVGLTFRYGPAEVARMLRNVQAARTQKVESLACETFWSRGAYRWGPSLAVHLSLKGVSDSMAQVASHDAQYLSEELIHRLQNADVRFELRAQRYQNERMTPIENTAVEWLERDSPSRTIAYLTIEKQDAGAADARADSQTIEEIRFNPWNTTDEFRPLGNLNRARKLAYDASSAQRLSYRWLTEVPLRNVIFSGISRGIFTIVNRFVPWHRLPPLIGLLNLDGFRHVLRRDNLLDTDAPDAPPTPRPSPPQVPEDVRGVRTFDGTFNDLSSPRMGAQGAPFGRNILPIYQPDLFDQPNPIVVSRELLARETFIPATSLNILAAAWIQFQVHDWVNHARYALGERDVIVPLPPGMQCVNSVGGAPENVMRIAGNKELEGSIAGAPIYGNDSTHWWDSSEVYGENGKAAKALRDGAKLRLPNGYLPEELNGQEITGFNQSWWLGLSMMHTLFAREHNVLCDELRKAYPTWRDERVFQTARLIVSALIAKIHTVEWTPAILATKAIDIALHANWSGPPSDLFSKLTLWLIDTHSLTGIPKTNPDHNGVPYSLTEDFITVYRMHPLIPDDYSFFDCSDGRKIADSTFGDIQGLRTDAVMRSTGLENVIYSFGIANPGAITLHNFPNGLRAFVRDNEIVDMAVVDIVRTRQRGVPRYNDFRAALHRPRIARWEDLTANPESVRRLREVYGDIDMVDTVVGLLGETPPEGFGFSDTAFRIFILMASRRIQSDRFLNVDFRPEIYSPLGIDWIANNGMTSVILRHCPELSTHVPRTTSAFAPWRAPMRHGFGTRT
jgi:hypothetical protein